MADKYEDLLLLGAAVCCTYVLRKKKRKRRPRFWIHPIIANRNDQGDYQHLIQELRSDPALFRRYFHGTLLVARYRKYYEKCKTIIKGDFGILGEWPPCPPKSAYAGELTDK